MNLLAHALLSPADPAILVGNLTADWVKGRARRALPESLQLGMTLHHHIDTFTDSHPLVHACSDLLEPKWGRYSPILVDIFFDHILSLDWHHHSPLPRADFIAFTYRSLRTHLHHLPPRAQYAANALLADDWLSSYATLTGISLCLSRLSSRLHATGHTVELAAATADLAEHQSAFESAFREFFPQLRTHVENLSPLPVHCFP